jgi:CBS domain-containing protein
MQVRDVMTPNVQLITADDTLQDAAALMAELDTGVLPVADGERLIGMLTDRDIAVRAVALGRGPDSAVREAMTADVKYCFADQDLDEVVANMAELQLRRLPVLDADKRLVGIVALGDIARREADEAGEALSDISRPAIRI